MNSGNVDLRAIAPSPFGIGVGITAPGSQHFDLIFFVPHAACDWGTQLQRNIGFSALTIKGSKGLGFRLCVVLFPEI